MQPLQLFRSPTPSRVETLSGPVLARAVLALAVVVALSCLTLPLMAREGHAMRLRGDVTARGDVLTLGDLVEGAPAEAAARPLFRAPALGAAGTIQARRIIEAAGGLGLPDIETGGRLQVSVQRAARRVGAAEIEAALKRALATGFSVEAKGVSVRLDGDGPTLLAPVDLDGQADALDVTYDPRSRRVAGLIVLGDRQASLRVSGQVVEIREIAVLTRTLARGEAVTASDLAIERRPREGVPADAQAGTAPLAGQVAQRGLTAGSILRSGDVAPPDLVLRGEPVTIVFETPGISLQMRGIATDGGRLGATVAIVNTASKKTLQATVIGPGRVSVGPLPGPQARAALARLD